MVLEGRSRCIKSRWHSWSELIIASAQKALKCNKRPDLKTKAEYYAIKNNVTYKLAFLTVH